jgi:hypothetical protein
MTSPLTKTPSVYNPDIALQIRQILETNQLEQLKEFISKHKCLNRCNVGLSYTFHIIQSAGILVTTVATGYKQMEYIWLGVALNILASLLNVFEKNNNYMMKKIAKDVEAIKEGSFIIETPLINTDEDKRGYGSPNFRKNNENTNDTNV